MRTFFIFIKKYRSIFGGILIAVLFLVIGTLIFLVSGAGSYKDMIRVITDDNPDVVLTVGVWDNGTTRYRVYGENGQPLPYKEHVYAIGSITKTFTGALIAKEESEGLIDINSGINEYLPILGTSSTPTIRSLMTHTSGLSDQWEQVLQISGNKALNRNDMIRILGNQRLPLDRGLPVYSNYGAALAATAAANIMQGSYEDVMNSYIINDLGLKKTRVGGTGDLDNYWPWEQEDEMMGAAGILSTASDLIEYGRMQLEETPSYLALCHVPLEYYNVKFDCGYFWRINKDNDTIWHNGEMIVKDADGDDAGFQTFLGFSKDKQRVVAVLSNTITLHGETDVLGEELIENGL